MSETQSYEPDISPSTPEMGVGEMAVDSDIQALLESSRQQIAQLQGEDAQTLGQEELTELESTLSGERADVIGASQYARLDLAEEFSEDVRVINVLERDFSSFPGYSEFMRLLTSNTLPDTTKEDLYDVVINNREELDMYLDLDLMGEMFPDSESLEDFLSIGLVEDNIERDEVEEILGFDIASANESDLLYMNTKVQAFIERSLATGSVGMEELAAVQTRIQAKLSEINQERINSQVVQLEIDAAQVETDTAQVETDTAQVETDTAQVETDTAQVETDTAQVEENRETNRRMLEHGLNIFLQYEIDSPIIQRLLEEAIQCENSQEMGEKIREIKVFLRENPGQLRDLLTQARDRGPTALRETQQFLGALAQDDPELQNMIRELELEMGLHNIANSEVREAQAMAFFGEEVEVTDIEIDGQVYRLGDMEIDASNRPPRSFLTPPEGNYRLEIELPGMPNNAKVLAARREFTQAKLDIREEFTPLAAEYREVQGKLNRLEQLRSVEESELSEDQLEEKRELEGQEIELQQQVETIKSQMRVLLERASNLSRDFETYLSGLEFDTAGIQAQKEKARRTLSFLYDVGFTDIPQVVTDQIIGTLNSNSALAHEFGFNERIDFANGQLGFDTFAGDSGTLDRADMAKFAEFVNRLIGAEVVNVEAVRNGSGVAISDRREFRTLLRESGLMDVGAFGVAMDNLRSRETLQE